MKKLSYSFAILLFSFCLLMTIGCSESVEKVDKKDEEVTEENLKYVNVAGILPITGVASVPGGLAQKGLELAVDDYKEKFDSLGWQLNLRVENSKGETTEAMTLLKMLNAEERPDLVYTQISGLSQTLKTLTEESNQFLFAQVGSNSIAENSKFAYRNFISPKTIGIRLSNLINDSLRFTKVGVISPNTEFGESLSSNFVKQSEKLGIKVLFDVSFNEDSNNHKSFLTGKVDKNVECIYVAGIGKSLGNIIRQLREIGYKNEIIGDVMIPFKDVKTEAKSALDGVYYLNFDYDPKSESKFNEKYQSKYSEDGHFIIATTYDALSIYFEQILSSNSKDPNVIKAKLDGFAFKGSAFDQIKIEENDFIYPIRLERIKL